ncbi:MAG TPA: AmmeMemoRadiSam system protein B [Steroidobacteraceae bacterium]|nr:AmmeMemoRadiSam system protein B [Steroidobacteraceae bacterium]
MQDHVSSSTVRRAAVAGMFYPDDPVELRATLERLLGSSAAVGRLPKAVIVPHAGYPYSGPVAAQAYGSLGPQARSLRRILLLGPSHHVWFRGLAAPDVKEFATPLGRVRLDDAALAQVRRLPAVIVSDAPHAREHSLEVQLPFLQRVAPAAEIVPLVAGETTPSEVAAIIAALWGSDDTLIVVSSDLSHYHPYPVAQALDARTAQAILDGCEDLTGEQACGCRVVNGLAHAVRGRHLHAELIDLRNSGDTAGDRKRVVGYGAFAFYDA